MALDIIKMVLNLVDLVTHTNISINWNQRIHVTTRNTEL